MNNIKLENINNVINEINHVSGLFHNFYEILNKKDSEIMLEYLTDYFNSDNFYDDVLEDIGIHDNRLDYYIDKLDCNKLMKDYLIDVIWMVNDYMQNYNSDNNWNDLFKNDLDINILIKTCFQYYLCEIWFKLDGFNDDVE
jgi:hypothetical protein